VGTDAAGMVDEGILDREAGEYWRAGGSYAV
jgi:hypothetical protein